MRNIMRIPRVLRRVQKEWAKHPDLRFFQFIEYLKSTLPKEYSGISKDFFYYEDVELIKELDARQSEVCDHLSG